MGKLERKVRNVKKELLIGKNQKIIDEAIDVIKDQLKAVMDSYHAIDALEEATGEDDHYETMMVLGHITRLAACPGVFCVSNLHALFKIMRLFPELNEETRHDRDHEFENTKEAIASIEESEPLH